MMHELMDVIRLNQGIMQTDSKEAGLPFLRT